MLGHAIKGRWFAFLGAVAVHCLFRPWVGWAQINDAPAVDSFSGQITALPSGPILPAESLGPDDLLELTVSYCPELSHAFRIGTDGSLALPLLHEKLMVLGLTPVQVANAVSEALQKEQIMHDPVVNVSVLEYRSRPVSVVGAVAHPVTFQATGETTLLDALTKAGGLSPTAGGNIIVTSSRPLSTQAENQLQSIPARDLISGANPRLNRRLHGGEEIRVPEASKIFIVGNVRHPGAYAMQGGDGTTVIKAIALSEGLDSFSSNTAFIYRHNNTTGDRDEIRVSLKSILSHKSPDIALAADDIVYVPTANGKRMTSKILNQIAGFGQTAGSGILIYK